MLHKEVITETGFDENAAEERQNGRIGFFFPFKIFFVEKKPLWEMTRCGAPIVRGICPSWTGILFEMGLKWNAVCAWGYSCGCLSVYDTELQ